MKNSENITDVNTNESISRFKDASWLNTQVVVYIIGLGGIGSHTSLLMYKTLKLKKMILIDKDTYEFINMGTQLTNKNFINIDKSYATKIFLSDFSTDFNSPYRIIPMTVDLTTKPNRFTNGLFMNDLLNKKPIIIVSAVDSMKVREIIFKYFHNKLLEYKTGNKNRESNVLLIDGRLNATNYEIFSVDLNNEKEVNVYSKSLIPDEYLTEGVCTMRQTFHFGSMIGSRITQIATHWVSNLETNDKNFKYKIPFNTMEIGDGFLFKTMSVDEYDSKIKKFK